MQPAGSNQHVFRRDAQPASMPQIISDGLAQRRNPARGNIAVASGSNGVPESIHDRGRWMKVRLAQFEMDDGATELFKLFGAGKNSQSAFAGQL